MPPPTKLSTRGTLRVTPRRDQFVERGQWTEKERKWKETCEALRVYREDLNRCRKEAERLSAELASRREAREGKEASEI